MLITYRNISRKRFIGIWVLVNKKYSLFNSLWMIAFNKICRYRSSKNISPLKLNVRRLFLGIDTLFPQESRQTSIWIVFQIHHILGYINKISFFAIWSERMNKFLWFHEWPKLRWPNNMCQIINNDKISCLNSNFPKCPTQMMMVNNIIALFRSWNHWDMMISNMSMEPTLGHVRQPFYTLIHSRQADSNLCWMKFVNMDRSMRHAFI